MSVAPSSSFDIENATVGFRSPRSVADTRTLSFAALESLYAYQPLIARPNDSSEPTLTVSPVLAARWAHALRNDTTRSQAVPSPTCTPVAVMTAGSISDFASTL